ncbi:MAG: alpha-E domain-containing protein, partial [Verrucomicrobiota bacterium]
RIERANIISGLLKTLIKSDIEGDMNTIFNESILYFLDSVRTYQSSFYEKPQTDLTVRLLLGHKDYPKSIREVLERLGAVLSKLQSPMNREHPTVRIEVMLQQLDSFLLEVQSNGINPDSALLFLDQLEVFFGELSDDITMGYFSHAIKQENE